MYRRLAGRTTETGGQMTAWSAVHLDEIAAEQWPYWAPIRHHLDIRTFGINAWRGKPGDEVIKRHHESESGAPELYIVLSGHAAFALGEEEVDAPAGTLVFVRDPATERAAFAKEDGTVVLSLGAAADGKAFSPSGWDTSYLEGT
jgi:mannose-6-phosphate isomerase-like protein (cupin superfamily)